MRSPSHAVRVALVVCLMAALLPVQLLADDCQGVTYGADSPEALIAGVQAAARATDMGQLAHYLSKADRAKAGLGLTIGATMMLAMQEMGMGMAPGEGGDAESAKADLAANQARFQGILDQYGVQAPDQASMQRVMQQGPDAMAAMESAMDDVCTAGLIRDLTTYLSETMEQKVTDQLERLTTEEFGPVTIEGDVATSSIGGETFLMNRIDGRWYVDLESTSGSVGPG